MKQHFKLLILFLIAIIYCSCSSNSRISDSDFEIRAQKIASCYDSTNIDVFKTWSFVARGVAGIWSKNSGDTSLYNCVYIDKGDSVILRVIGYNDFLKDFKANLSVDTSIWQITFTQFHSGVIKLTGVNKHGRDILIFNNKLQDSIFKSDNPFAKFNELTAIKDSFDFIGIRYYKDLGGFIQIYLSPQYILTYIPEIGLINPQYRQIWKVEFEKGKMIKKHWNLRKLDKPIDNG